MLSSLWSFDEGSDTSSTPGTGSVLLPKVTSPEEPPHIGAAVV
jgi:hypothetical protein